MSCVSAASVSVARWHHRVVFTVASPWLRVASRRAEDVINALCAEIEAKLRVGGATWCADATST